MNKPTPHEIKQAEKFVDDFTDGNLLGKNTKLLDDGITYQARIGNKLRVQFNSAKKIVAIFQKPNHKSHR